MRSIAIAVAAAVSFVSLAGSAFADAAHDRSEAIRICRAEVATRAGVEADSVRLTDVRGHGRQIRVELNVWRAGVLTHVRCDVAASSDGPQIASIDPPLAPQSAAAAQ